MSENPEVKAFPAPEQLATPPTTVGLLEDIIEQTETRTWFLYEYLKDTGRFD